MKSTLRTCSTEGQDFGSYVASFFPQLAPKPGVLRVGPQSLASEKDEELQDVLMGHWNVSGLPLPDGILLCPFTVLTTEVILMSERQFWKHCDRKNT